MKNKKLLTVIPVACATAITANAGTGGDIQSNNAFDGAYIGIAGGILSSKNDNRMNLYNYTYTYFEDDNYQNLALKNGIQSGAGFISLGYGQLFTDKFYLGAEAALALANNRHKIIDYKNALNFKGIYNSFYTNVERTNAINAKLNYAEFDLDLKLGTTLSPNTLFYGKVGAAFNRFKLEQYFSVYMPFDNTDLMTGLAHPSASKSAVGLRVGLGMEHLITNCLSVKVDYMYTWYPSLNAYGAGTVSWLNDFSPPIPNGITSAISSKINTQTILLGVNLYLDSFFS